MRHFIRGRRQILLFGHAVLLILLGTIIWLALSVEAFYRLAPPGSDEFRIQLVNASQVKVSYRLPRGLPWRAVYDRLTNQGWIIRDDELLVWPDLMDDSHTAAVFWRSGWLGFGRQWLTVHKDLNDPQRFMVEIVQCAANALSAPCN
jgi:hypothetical protein